MSSGVLSVEVIERLDALPDDVRATVRDVLGARDRDDGVLEADLPGAVADDMPLCIEVSTDGDGTVARLATRFQTHVPYFGWALRPVLLASARRAVRTAGTRVRARLDGRPDPGPPKPFPFAPPVAFSPAQATFLATVAMCGAVASFGASLASQNVHFVARSFDISDAVLGVALAASRAGVLIGLVASALADRRGRRKLLLLSVAGVCLGNAVSALAPSIVAFTAGQVLVRGFSNAAFAVAGIAVVEEAPEGARAYTVSMLSIAAAAGYAPGLALVSIGDAGPHAWRIAFSLSAISVVLLPGIARRLRETGRYQRLETRHARRGRVREVLDSTYGRRFGLLVAVGFLGAIFGAPGAQMQNRYLAEVRGFSGLDITIFIAATGAPGLLGVLLGGRLAEAHGRRPVAAWGLLATTILQILFFVVGGPLLWLISVGSSLTGGMLAPVLGALGAEMFATEIRGTANGMLIVAGVAGAAVGLVTAGWLGTITGDIGLGIAITGIAALVVVPLIRLLPESAFRNLEDVSPSEV